MIGFSPLPYGDPNRRVLDSPLVANSNATPLATTASQGLKRLASSREELERSWHSPGGLVHSVSCSRDSFEEDAPVERTFKRQRTIDIDSAADTAMATATPEYSSVVGGLRINPDNRPPRPAETPRRLPVKAGWYHGHVDYVGNRHGRGHTQHDDGTEYDGSYVNDVMDGWGRFKFTTVKQLVSFPSRHSGATPVHSATLHRVTERVFEGIFQNDKPSGKGMMITTVVDSLPHCVATTGMEVKYVKVVYDVGFYKDDGRQVGEGARFTYSKSTSMSEWEEVCTRTWNGECSGVKVGKSYGNWVCDCLNLPSYPEVPSF